MKFDKILGFVKIGLPPLLSFIGGLFKKKTYTSDEIHEKSKQELHDLQSWEDRANAEYEETMGK